MTLPAVSPTPQAGYTLPVFACAAAIAALRHLYQDSSPAVPVDLLNPAQTVEIAIEQVARLTPTSALAITRSDPGDNLDLTRHTPIWALVELKVPGQRRRSPLTAVKGWGDKPRQTISLPSMPMHAS